MRNTFYIIIATMMGWCMCVYGQDKKSLLERINSIKSQNDIYYWNQYTWYSADTAKINATSQLLSEVNCYRAENEQLTVEELMPHADYIVIDRGNAKQYFAYIKKTDAIAIKKIGEISIPPPDSPKLKPFVADAFTQRIMETGDFVNVYKLLKSLQEQGQVLQFGKLKDVEDYSSLELILFDMSSQQIITMLSPVNSSGHRTNLVGGFEDSLDNYPTKMTAVIWYIKK